MTKYHKTIVTNPITCPGYDFIRVPMIRSWPGSRMQNSTWKSELPPWLNTDQVGEWSLSRSDEATVEEKYSLA